MSATTKTLLPSVIDSALLREDIERLLDALRVAEDGAEALAEHRILPAWRWEKVLERADLLRQSYSLARARAAIEGGGR